MNLLLIRAGYPIAVIPLENRLVYLNALVTAQQSNDSEPFVKLVEKVVRASLTDTLRTLYSATEANASAKPFYQDLVAWLS